MDVFTAAHLASRTNLRILTPGKLDYQRFTTKLESYDIGNSHTFVVHDCPWYGNNSIIYSKCSGSSIIHSHNFKF